MFFFFFSTSEGVSYTSRAASARTVLIKKNYKNGLFLKMQILYTFFSSFIFGAEG